MLTKIITMIKPAQDTFSPIEWQWRVWTTLCWQRVNVEWLIQSTQLTTPSLKLSSFWKANPHSPQTFYPVLHPVRLYRLSPALILDASVVFML